jgi:hypothetical protein
MFQRSDFRSLGGLRTRNGRNVTENLLRGPARPPAERFDRRRSQPFRRPQDLVHLPHNDQIYEFTT